MNEQKSKPKEIIHIEKFSSELHSFMKEIRDYFYELLYEVESESKKIQNNNNQNEIDNDKNKIYKLWNFTKNTLRKIIFYLSLFNNKNYIIKYDNYINNYFMSNNKTNLKIINDLYYLIYKDFIFINNDLLFDYVKQEKKFIEKNEKRMRINYYTNINIIESKSINDYIYEFIQNNFNDLSNKGQGKEKEIQKKKENIYFNCQKKPDKSIIKIKIEFFIFNIIIKIPYEKEYDLYNYLTKTFVNIKYKYTHPYNPNLKTLGHKLKQEKEKIKNNLLILEREIEIMKNNILEKEKLEKEKEKLEKEKIKNELELNKIEIEKNFVKIEQYKNNYLLNKFKHLIENRIKSIIKFIFEENENSKLVILKSNFLIEFCKRFIYYIHDYNNLFKAKCVICQKIAKYSFSEKCFYPPYIKIYKERNIFNIKNNNICNENLFYHEECIRKINLSYL